jgi:Tfp pilus assembly major pilin PilA
MRPIIAMIIVAIMVASALTAIGLLLYQMGVFG